MGNVVNNILDSIIINRNPEKEKREGERRLAILQNRPPPEVSHITEAIKDCPICFDPISDRASTTLVCGHAFHQDCLAQATASVEEDVIDKGLCPICRQPVNRYDLQTEYIIGSRTLPYIGYPTRDLLKPRAQRNLGNRYHPYSRAYFKAAQDIVNEDIRYAPERFIPGMMPTVENLGLESAVRGAGQRRKSKSTKKRSRRSTKKRSRRRSRLK